MVAKKTFSTLEQQLADKLKMIQVMGTTGSCPHSTSEQLAATFFITL